MRIEDDNDLKLFLVELFKKEVPDIFNGNLRNNERKALDELKQIVFVGKQIKQLIKRKEKENNNINNWSEFSIDTFIDELILQILKENNFNNIFDWNEDEFEQILSSMTIVIEEG